MTNFRNAATGQLSHFRNDESFGPGGVLSGFDFSSGSATSITLTAGFATIRGYHCEETTTISGTLVANRFNFVFLTVDASGGLATDLILTVADTATFDATIGPLPDNTILIWCFETDGSSIITQFDFRTVGSNTISGSYIGTGTSTRTINLGVRPKMVHVYHNDDDKIEAHSPSAVPRPTGDQDGLLIAQVGSAECIVQKTSDGQHVPILLSNGFQVEAGSSPVNAMIPLRASETFDPPSTASSATWQRIVTVPGALSIGSIVRADFSLANFYGPQDWQFVGGAVTAVDTVTVTFQNISPGIRDLGSGTLTTYVYEASPSLQPWALNRMNDLYYFTAWF